MARTLKSVYGWTLNTQAAVLGDLVALIVTNVLAGIFVNISRLLEHVSEAATFLDSDQPAAECASWC